MKHRFIHICIAGLLIFPCLTWGYGVPPPPPPDGVEFPEALGVTTAATFVNDTAPSSVRNTFQVTPLQTDPVVQGGVTFRRCTISGSPLDGATNVGNCRWATFIDDGLGFLRISFNFRVPDTSGNWGQFILINTRGIGRFSRFYRAAGADAIGAVNGPVTWIDNGQ